VLPPLVLSLIFAWGALSLSRTNFVWRGIACDQVSCMFVIVCLINIIHYYARTTTLEEWPYERQLTLLRTCVAEMNVSHKVQHLAEDDFIAMIWYFYVNAILNCISGWFSQISTLQLVNLVLVLKASSSLTPRVLANTMPNRPPPPDRPPRDLTAPVWPPPNPSTWVEIDHAKVSEMPNRKRQVVRARLAEGG